MALEPQRLDREKALQIVRYYTWRNYIAYQAHRKKRLRNLKKRSGH